MRGSRLRNGVGAVAAAAVLSLAAAGAVRADPTGPTAFYFGANCTGIGEVILTNAGPSRAAGLQVIGTNTIVLVPKNRAIEGLGTEAGTTCTFHAFGSDPNNLEETDPQTFPVVIVNG